ncbi:MAG: hypothetical protein IKA37_02365, partial [Spirochaetales bacterium]|nr:hypothetical protein [Spirochaetales bacterium]
CIGTMTGNWKVPGEPMVKNAQGEWEYRFVMERAKEFYKFYDPALEGDIAYFEDPEMPESVANPFGSKNGVVRRPKAGGAGAAAAAEAEEEYPKLNFGMWSRNTYNMWFGSNLSRKVAYDKDGKVAKEGTTKIDGGLDEKVEGDNQNMAVVDQNLSHRWEGENGTTAGNATRVWLDKTRFRSSSTFKVHGMVFKHMQLDAEINFNFNVETNYSSYWKASDKTARVDAMNEIQRDAASQYMGLLFGPFAKNGAWGRYVGEYTSTWDSSLNSDNNVIWIDQIVISFPFDDFEAKLGIMGNNGAKSKDPMGMLSGARTGWKEEIASNIEFYIHPKKVKGLNILVGLAHSWRDMADEKGGGEVWLSGATNPGRMLTNDHKYMAYLNADYKVGNVAEFGAVAYWASWSPSALDMFMNGELTVAPWVRVTPIKGLTIEAEVATNASTIYMNNLEEDDNILDYAKYRTKKNEWDIFANSAVLANVTYVMPSFFNVGVSFKAAGTMFKGLLGAQDGQFSGWDDSSRRVNGTENYTVGANPYYDNDRGASILTAVDFAIYPLKNKLLKVGTKEELVFGKMDSPLMKDEEEYDGDKRQIDFLSSPFIGTQWKNLSANLGVTFSYTNYQDGKMKVDGEITSTNLFTFNTVWLDFAYSNISKVLKSVEFLYQMEVGYNDGYYTSTTKEIWDIVGNSIQANKMYNQFRATLYFDKDISLGIGFILRNFWEHNDSILGALSPAMLEKFDNDKVQKFTTAALDPEELKQAYWEGRTDYWNVGWALQFKWKLPLEKLQFPTFFVNLGLGWDPFDDDGSTTCNWYTGNDSAGQSSVYKNNKDYTAESSVFTVGLQWDF